MGMGFGVSTLVMMHTPITSIQTWKFETCSLWVVYDKFGLSLLDCW